MSKSAWRPCWVYDVSWILNGNMGEIAGLKVVESYAQTTAPPEDHGFKSPGGWRSDGRQSQESVLAWLAEYHTLPMTKFVAYDEESTP